MAALLGSHFFGHAHGHHAAAARAALSGSWGRTPAAERGRILSRIGRMGLEAGKPLKQARAEGKVVIGMKIFGAGKLTSPEQKDASLKFVWSNGLVDAVTIGMLSPQEIDDTIERMNKVFTA